MIEATKPWFELAIRQLKLLNEENSLSGLSQKEN
jgi:hypothetical protein